MSVQDLINDLQESNERTKYRRRNSVGFTSSLAQSRRNQMQAAASRRAGGRGGRRGSVGGLTAYTGVGGGGKGGKIGRRVARPKNLHPNAPIVGIKDGQGHTVYVNKQVAPNFKGLLRAIKRRGYKIHDIYGHADRNIAGSSTPSLHSYGFAIDINPGANPVTYGRRKTNLPRGIGRIARRYGLEWGGNWNGSKKDTMHFSVPFRGTK